MSTTQPEALRLADWLEDQVVIYQQFSEGEPGGYAQEVDQVMDEAAAELRRLHAENAALRARVQELGQMARDVNSRRVVELEAQLASISPTEGMAAEQALRKVLAAVQRYLPHDGPSAKDTLTKIIEIVDPWPSASRGQAPAGATGIQWQCGPQATGYGAQPDAGVLEDAARLDWIAVHGSFGVDSVSGELGGNGQRRLAATRSNIDAARAQQKGQSHE